MRFDPDRPITTTRFWRVVHRVTGWGVRGFRTAAGVIFLLLGVGFIIAAVGVTVTGLLSGDFTASIIIFLLFAPIGALILMVAWFVLRGAVKA